MKLLCTLKQRRSQNFIFQFNLIFISIRKIFWKYPNFFGENPGTNQNFIAR